MLCRNLCITEKYIQCQKSLFFNNSSWTSLRVPKCMLWVHAQSFNLKFSQQCEFWHVVLFFSDIILESLRNVDETPAWSMNDRQWCSSVYHQRWMHLKKSCKQNTIPFQKVWFAAKLLGWAEYLPRSCWIICLGTNCNKQVTTSSLTYAKLKHDWIWQNRCRHPFHHYH